MDFNLNRYSDGRILQKAIDAMDIIENIWYLLLRAA